MTQKSKRLGTKAKIRAEKEKQRRIATAIFITIILITVMLSAYFGYQIFSSPLQNENILIKPTKQFKPANPNPELKAAIVDQLSLTFPNETFVEEAAATFVNDNYTVDYFSGEKVTVEFYRNLPAYAYKMVILRVHSVTGLYNGKQIVSLFTSELYSDKRYVYEQLTDQVGEVRYSAEDAVAYFGISQEFVKSSMNKKFEKTTIIMMGCEGLNNTKMAEAFIQKGAKICVGWKGSVSASHTDTATTTLLQHLITEKETIEQAVEKTIKEVGPDPAYKGILLYYPIEVGKEKIENT